MFFCKLCKEPTTHVFKEENGREKYVCLCCESEKVRGKDATEQIKKSRKGGMYTPP
ncbi:MAG: hypothetical protein IPO09_11665 [Anaeromyxobacter sp.]|nr:hypothetical protein [Anaeromyxobacter sp.]MBL0276249.1 hypothetical protein [Anaeromyxobacter sp.]